MTKQNRDFVASTRPTFVFDEPSFDEQPGTVGAPMILRPGTQMRKPTLPKIGKSKWQKVYEGNLGISANAPNAPIYYMMGGRLVVAIDFLNGCWRVVSNLPSSEMEVASSSGFVSTDGCLRFVAGMPANMIVPPRYWNLFGIKSWAEASLGGDITQYPQLLRAPIQWYGVHGVPGTVGAPVGRPAQQFGAALAELAGVEPATISCPPGQALYMGRCVPRVRVPGGTLGAPAGRPAMYVVAPGDTTSGIAEKLGVSVPALLAANASRPRMQLRSGHWVFKNLTEREKLNVPRQRTIGLAGAPGALSAGPGEACGYTDWCDSGYHCENGVCVPDFVPAQAGLSNTGAYCDAGGGPQSGYIGEGGACIPLGGNTQGAGSNTIIGNVVCPGPNMHPDWDNISAWQCVCDDGFTDDPNGPGCVPVGTPGTYTVGSQQFYEECVAAGGEIDPATGQCRAKGGVSGQGTQFGGKSTSGGAAGGGKAGATTGGKAGPVEPVDGKSSLIGSLSSTAKTVIMIGGGVLAVAAVGGGAYAIAKHRKDAKMKAKGGKDEKKPSPKALPPKKK